MTIRRFTRQQLAAIGVPPDRPDDIEYSDVLLADEFVMTLKYSQERRVIFRAEDDGLAYAVTYEAPLDTGDFEVGGDGPPDYGWYGPTVEAVGVAAIEVTVTQWMPVADGAPVLNGPSDAVRAGLFREAADRFEAECPDAEGELDLCMCHAADVLREWADEADPA